jgi:hypothetical protein
MVYTLGQAAKATGKSKAAISQAIATSRISASKDEFGRWQIDPADLHRVYPQKGSEVSDTAPKAELNFMREKIELLERLVEQITQDRDRLLLLLPKPTEQKPESTALPKRRGWFGRRTG